MGGLGASVGQIGFPPGGANISPGPPFPGDFVSSSSESIRCMPSGFKAPWEKGAWPFSKQACRERWGR